MSIEADCPVCDSQGYIDETAPPSHNCDVIGKKCLRCSGSGSVEVEITCSVCDNGVIEEGVGFCSEKCYKADIGRQVDKALVLIILKLQLTAGGLRINEQDYAKEAASLPDLLKRTSMEEEWHAIARTARNMCCGHAETLEKIIAQLKGGDYDSVAGRRAGRTESAA